MFLILLNVIYIVLKYYVFGMMRRSYLIYPCCIVFMFNCMLGRNQCEEITVYEISITLARLSMIFLVLKMHSFNLKLLEIFGNIFTSCKFIGLYSKLKINMFTPGINILIFRLLYIVCLYDEQEQSYTACQNL